MMEEQSRASIWVVIAAYNEERAVGEVIAALASLEYRIVVVDDGSVDRTAEIVDNTTAMRIEHPINLGQGAALQTGIEFALSNGADFIVTFDADGQHQPSDIPRLIDALHRHGADFALGSRFLGTAQNIPWHRRILLRVATWFARKTTRLRLTDAHNGLRAMTRKGARRIHLHQNRMAHASEILHQIAISGLGYVEVPVTIRYSAYSLAKGQRTSAFVIILLDLFARGLRR
jgi:glycosyltransferase involved in cell wall biosynthesis